MAVCVEVDGVLFRLLSAPTPAELETLAELAAHMRAGAERVAAEWNSPTVPTDTGRSS